MSVMVWGLLLTVTSCVNQIEDTNDSETHSRDFTFVVNDYTMTPISTKATDAKTFKFIDAAIYKKGADNKYILYQKINQAKDDTGFGTLEFTSVDYGTYLLVILGHAASESIDLTNPEDLQLSPTTVPEFQYYTQEITVNATSDPGGEVNTTLGVARFTVTFTECIPNTVKKFRMTIKGTSMRWNALTHLGIGEETRTITLNLKDKDYETPNVTVGCYLLLNQEKEEQGTSDVEVKLEALDADDVCLKSHVFNSLPAQVGYTTDCTGAFFDNTFSLITIKRQETYSGGYNINF